MTTDQRHGLDDCLAYVATRDDEDWLGLPSPNLLQALLDGTSLRADLTRHRCSTWRIYGPLNEERFYQPLVARTGHPTLSIRWATALELYHFSMPAAMRELEQLIRGWSPADHPGADAVFEPVESPNPDRDLRDILRKLARRPGIFLNESSGWALHAYMTGLDRGGDWIGAPELLGVRELVQTIEERSVESYGSTFGAYRVYSHDPETLLAGAGIEPE